MFAPTPEQQNIIDHLTGHALIVAGPGSGKTVTLIAHVKKMICERKVLPNDIWVMAFNRDISSKLKEKIQSEIGEKSPRATTIHTFILSQTLKYGAQLLDGFEIAESLGECGMRNLLWEPISRRLRRNHGIEKTSQGKRLDIRHVKGYLWNQIRDYWLTSQKVDDNIFDKFNFEIERFKAIYKIVFLDELAIKFLDALKANPSFRRDVAKSRIVIDEFQDLNPTEHGILQQFHKEGTTFVVFGDDDQAVNDFRRAHADYIRDFEKTYNPTKYPLTRDRRCPKEILELADEFVKRLPRIEKPSGYARHKGKIDILNFVLDEDEKKGIKDILTKYLSIFSRYNGENPQVLILCSAIGKVKTQTRGSEVVEILNKAGIKEITGETKEDPLDNEWGVAFKSLSGIIVKDLSPMNLAAWLSVTNRLLMGKVNEYIEQEERKGNQVDFLRAVFNLRKQDPILDNLISDLYGLKEKVKDESFNPKIITDFMPNNLDGVDKGELFLNNLWEESRKDSTTRVNNFDTDDEKLNEASRFLELLNRHITEDIKKSEVGRVHVTTYRKAKGLEADLVIVTSVDSSDFSDDPQKRRLLYVAATRSKRNLILTFADRRSGARRYTQGRSNKFKGVPRVYRSSLIPSNYPTQEYSEEWLNNWNPL